MRETVYAVLLASLIENAGMIVIVGGLMLLGRWYWKRKQTVSDDLEFCAHCPRCYETTLKPDAKSTSLGCRVGKYLCGLCATWVHTVEDERRAKADAALASPKDRPCG